VSSFSPGAQLNSCGLCFHPFWVFDSVDRHTTFRESYFSLSEGLALVGVTLLAQAETRRYRNHQQKANGDVLQ
jgi:hypothetical protein